jgi:hypothetical protein
MGQALGFWVEQLPAMEIEHEAVSSTRIRKAIMNGEIQKAIACLHDSYMLIGTIIKQNEFYLIPVVEECKIAPSTRNICRKYKDQQQETKLWQLLNHHGIAVLSYCGKDINVNIKSL